MGSTPFRNFEREKIRTAEKLRNAICECGRPLEHGQKLLKCREIQSDVYKMHEKAWRPGIRPGPRWGSLQRSPGPLAGGRAGCLLPKNPTPALDLSGLVCPRPIIFRFAQAKIPVLFLVPPLLYNR